jgi:hypothetical protein
MRAAIFFLALLVTQVLALNGRRVRCVFPAERPDPAGRLTHGGSHALVIASSQA